MVNRPVKIVYTRRQMFTGNGYRPAYWQKVSLGADANGKLQAIKHDLVINTSTTEEYSESYSRPARNMYACPNVSWGYKITKTDLPTPAAMRAPSMVSSMTGLESALDELAYACKIDPLQIRLINYAETDPDTGKPFSSKALKECYQLAADKFGWSKRNPRAAKHARRQAPRRLGHGQRHVAGDAAAGDGENHTQGRRVCPCAVRDGRHRTRHVHHDDGIAAECLGIDAEKVKAELGDTKLPRAPSQGGSWTTATVGSAIYGAAESIRKKLLKPRKARKILH